MGSRTGNSHLCRHRHCLNLRHATTLTCANFSKRRARTLACRLSCSFCFLTSGCSVACRISGSFCFLPEGLLHAAKPASANTSLRPPERMMSRVASRMASRVAAEYTFVCDALLLPPPPLLLVLCVLRSCSMCSRKGSIFSVDFSLVPKYPPPL